MSHHLQRKRKIILDFIASRIKDAGAKKKDHIDTHQLENLVIWNYGTTRQKASELIDIVLEVINLE
jgi:hypothetical protein